jgi:hypothetical protein
VGCDTILRLSVVAYRAVVTMCVRNMCFVFVGMCVYACMQCMCVCA